MQLINWFTLNSKTNTYVHNLFTHIYTHLLAHAHSETHECYICIGKIIFIGIIISKARRPTKAEELPLGIIKKYQLYSNERIKL